MTKAFEQRLEEENLKTKRLALIGFYAMTLVSLGLTATIFYLAPLKITEVKLLVVDKNTGYTSSISTLENFETGKAENISAETAMAKYFVQHYIQMHDSYNHYAVRNAWEQVQIFSTEEVFAAYAQRIKDGSMPALLGKDKNMEVNILSLKPLPTKTDFKGKNTGQIMEARVERMIKDVYGNVYSKQTGTVIVTFGFDDKLKMEERARNANPLGFTVTAYVFNPDQIQEQIEPQENKK